MMLAQGQTMIYQEEEDSDVPSLSSIRFISGRRFLDKASAHKVSPQESTLHSPQYVSGSFADTFLFFMRTAAPEILDT